MGPTSRHWKRLAREVHNKAAQIGGDPINGKCVGPTPLQELDPNISDLKRRRGSTGQNKKKNGEEQMIGSGCSAAPSSHMNVIAWNYRGLGSSLAVRTLTVEVRTKKPLLVFLLETKAGTSRIKSIQNKLDYTQGITIPSDGRSGGLAILWREGTDVRFKSCSNSHIDVEIHERSSVAPWQATGFYGQPDIAKRFISWQLMEVLEKQSNLSWVVFGDFNEISQSYEKLGGPERDAGQMKEFRECLSSCGLFDLGFVG